MARRSANGIGRDFDEEARKLFQLLNLSSSGAATEASSRLHRYRDLDAVWRHPTSGGQVFIGNQTAASTRRILQESNITHVVNCTSDMPLYFKGKDDSIKYFRFDIYKFYRQLDLSRHDGVLEFFLPVFTWIDEAVAAGHSVLIHCLAGAHRAGTTGVAYTMHASDLEATTAITACQACRPAVDPISELRTLLLQLGRARREQPGYRELQASSAAQATVPDEERGRMARGDDGIEAVTSDQRFSQQFNKALGRDLKPWGAGAEQDS